MACITTSQSVSVDSLVSEKLSELDGLCAVETEVQFEKAKLSHELELLHLEGVGAPLVSVLKKAGNTTITTAEHQALQAEALGLVPEFGLEIEPIGVDYLEITARKLSNVDDVIREKISPAWLLDLIRRVAPDEYRKRLTRRIDEIDADQRRNDFNEQWRNSEGSSTFNHRTQEGHVHTRFAAHEWELATKLIEAEMKRMAASSDAELSLDNQLFAQAHLNLLLAGSAPNRQGAWSNKASQPKPLIEIVADAKTFATQKLRHESVVQTSMGTNLSIETLQRHTCDALIRKVLTDKTGIPVNVGRKHRTATDAQRAAARTLHPTCAWSDCQTRFDRCDVHHIKEWKNGGPTNFDNLVPLCNEHHHKVHEGKWSIKLLPDRRLEYYKPNGTHWKTSEPPTRKLEHDPPDDEPAF